MKQISNRTGGVQGEPDGWVVIGPDGGWSEVQTAEQHAIDLKSDLDAGLHSIHEGPAHRVAPVFLGDAPQPAPAVQGEPVAWQYFQDGEWWNGDDRIKDHRKNTEAADIPTRDLHAAPQPEEQPTPDPTDDQILAITTAYEMGVGKGHDAHRRGTEISNPYGTSWGCDKAWQMGYEEGKEQAANGAKSLAGKVATPNTEEQSECGCCGQTIQCDDDCDAKRPAPDVSALVEALGEIAAKAEALDDGGDGCDDETARSVASDLRGLIAAHRQQGGGE